MARTGRGCPSAHVVARMKLLPTETVRATASHSNHERLVARLRQTEVEKLYTLASGGWMQYTVDSWCVLISTADVSQRLEIAVYEPLTLHIPMPPSHGKRRKAGADNLLLHRRAQLAMNNSSSCNSFLHA